MAKKATFKGPGGTRYVQIAKTNKGRLGIANLGGGEVRVRIEPAKGFVEKIAAKLPDWNQPDATNTRLSTVVDIDKAEAIVAKAKKVVGSDTSMTAKAALGG